MRVLFVLALIVSGWSLLTPDVPDPDSLDFAYKDKVVHIAIFFSLAFTGRLALFALDKLAIGLTIYACATELWQYAAPVSRTGSWTDLAANFVGVAVGLGAAALVMLTLGRVALARGSGSRESAGAQGSD